jgi:hypothetical protein
MVQCRSEIISKYDSDTKLIRFGARVLGFYPSGNFLYSPGIVKNDSLRTDVGRDVVIDTTPA